MKSLAIVLKFDQIFVDVVRSITYRSGLKSAAMAGKQNQCLYFPNASHKVWSITT